MQKPETKIIKVRSNNSIVFTIILIVLFIISVCYMIFINNRNADIGQLNDVTFTTKAVVALENDAPLEENSVNQITSVIDTQTEPHSYREYLFNVNMLVINFLQDKDYSRQLRCIESIELPTKIKNILLDLHSYQNNYLVNKDSDLIRVFPETNCKQNCCWIEKVIKIEKKSNIAKNKEKLKASIIGNLEILINFFYSEEFQQKLQQNIDRVN